MGDAVSCPQVPVYGTTPSLFLFKLAFTAVYIFLPFILQYVNMYSKFEKWR
jgi:hypothetical protein